MILLVYVDDLLITGNSKKLVVELKSVLEYKFKMKDLSELRYFLGLEILWNLEGIVLTQIKYAIELIFKVGLLRAKPSKTPMEVNISLTSVAYDESLKSIKDDVVLSDAIVYRRIIGKLLYITLTRSDIAFSVNRLSQFMQYPKKSNLGAAFRVIKYVRFQPSLVCFNLGQLS